jgi:2-amino-4-hydroxy-6-hydroxymethyldihydropteridine diphosphokinase
MPATAYIALGANLGDRRANIEIALEKLGQAPGIKVRSVSTLIENAAVGGPADSPPFLNGAAELETSLTASELLNTLLEIEKEIGRVRREKWGPRLIDLDLLLYGDQVISGAKLTVPHPLLHTRRFVLEPLVEIAPEVVHPLLHKTIGALFGQLIG